MVVLNKGSLTGILYLFFLKFKVGAKRLWEEEFFRYTSEDLDYDDYDVF